MSSLPGSDQIYPTIFLAVSQKIYPLLTHMLGETREKDTYFF